MKKIIILFTIYVCMALTTSLYGQFSGGTYTIGTDGGENYSSLLSACAALNAAGSLGGNVIFEITTDLTEAANIPLGVNTNGYTLTFRPSEDVDKIISFTQTSYNGLEVGNAPLGAFVIGTTALTNYNNLVPTSNVVITGFPIGGSTNRLTIRKTGASNSARNYPISIVGNCENTSISNLTIDFSEGSAITDYHFAIALITYKNGSGSQYAPDFFTLDNCLINATLAYSTWGVGALLGGFNGYSYLGDFPDNFIIKNSNFTCQGGAIYLSDFADVEIINNNFSISSTSASANIYGIKVESRLDYADITIRSNKFTLFSSKGSTNRNESVISITGNYNGGSSYIYNNMMSGIEKPITSGSGNNLHLMSVSSDYASIKFNTLIMNNLSSDTYMAAFAPYRGISLSNNMSFSLKNNIIVIDEDDFQTVGIYFEDNNEVPPDTSDYNNVYRSGTVNAKFGYADGTFCASLEDWKIAVPFFDANSISKSVSFVAGDDLHLSGASLGDVDLIGTPISGITTDIDGETRHVTHPYMGADENLATPLPVELTSFSALVLGGDVKLNWQTATEVNNYGFEIERAIDNGQLIIDNWEKIGFVDGHGNSISPKQYSFIDANSVSGKIQYRLKQIDNNGKYEYSQEIEIELGILIEFSLSQNYPNPFNLVTTINYQIPVGGIVTLKIYDVIGREIKTLISEAKSAGNYSIEFNASELASGVYVYRLSAGNFNSTKKLLLMK
jgi:hypothetical protein